MTHRKYPESFFKDLTKFAEKDILPKQAQLDTEYADYLISLILASPSASTKTLITKIISFYYKENKTLNQIASEVNRSYNHTFTLKNRGLAIIVRLLRKTGSSDSIDEMGRIITTDNEEDTQNESTSILVTRRTCLHGRMLLHGLQETDASSQVFCLWLSGLHRHGNLLRPQNCTEEEKS